MATSNERGRQEFVERRDRRKKDWVSFSITLIAIVGWLLGVVAMLFLDFARPATETFWTRIFQQPVQSNWNRSLLIFILVVLVLDFLLCMMGFFLNMTRHKRKSDKYNKGIIVLWALSAVIIVVFLVVFGGYLF